MELPRLKTLLPSSRTYTIVAPAAAILAICLGLSAVAARQPDDGSSLDQGPRVTAPRSARIKVQILNATSTNGLAARATRYLRDRGFDVVDVGTESSKRDSTLIVDRTGRAEWASLVARAFGVPKVETHVDSTWFVDVTVLLGSDWTPPPGSFGS